MDIFWTILAGAGTFVLGQIILKLLIDPVQSLKSTVAEIANKLILYANIYANPRERDDEKQLEMANELRNLSSTLQSNMYLIPAYKFTRYIFGLPPIKEIVYASGQLIYIHNGFKDAANNQGILNCYAAQKSRLALNIFIPTEEFLNPENEAHFIKELKGSVTIENHSRQSPPF